MSTVRAPVRPRQGTIRVYVGYSDDFAAEAGLIRDKFIDVEGFETNFLHPDARELTALSEKVLVIPSTSGSVPEQWARVLSRFSLEQLPCVLVIPDDLKMTLPWSVRFGASPETYANVIRRRVLANIR